MAKILKYRNKKVSYQGIDFDSKKEMYRYIRLKSMQEEGLISDLRLQVPFELIPAIYEDEIVKLKTKTKVVKRCVQKAVKYVADFVYKDKDGSIVVEDVKGSSSVLTPEFRLKMKLMRYVHGIQIKIYE